MRFRPPSRLALLALGHFTVDAYSSFFSPLLPLLVTRLDLNLTRVGALVALASVASSFSQPLFGLWSDRLRRPLFVWLGPVTAALFLSAVGLATSYPMLIALLMVGGMGVSAFHPQSAVIASRTGERRALSMSVFVTGGTLGFALGPLLAVTVAGRFGLERTWLAAIPGLLIAAVLARRFARMESPVRHEGPRPALSELKPVLGPLSLLYVTVVCRSAVSYGFMTFLPFHLNRRGFDVTTGGHVLTAYLAAGAAGGFVGGWLADRWGGRGVLVRSFVFSLPLFFAFLVLPDVPGLIALIAGGFLLQSSLPVGVVLGQELSPRHASTITSLLMGAAWGVGALLIGPVGALADRYGLPPALAALAGLLFVGLACTLALPSSRHRAEPASVLEPPAAAS